MRTLDEFNGKYKEKTMACILGSGPSLFHQNLELLKNYVVFTVNSSILAYPEADFFVSDDEDCFRFSYYTEDLRNSNATVLLYEDKLGHTAHLFGDRAVLFRHKADEKMNDEYSHNIWEKKIFRCRSSFSSAIHIAHIMQCSPIILLGLDACRDGSIRWFWQHPDFPNKPRRTDGRPIDRYKRTRRRNTSTDTDLLDILQYWQMHGREINKKCTVYNASGKTVVDVFPRMPLEEILEKFGDRKK